MQEGLDTTAAADNSSELWAMAPCDTTVIPGGVVLTSRRDESRVVVMQEVAVALQQCTGEDLPWYRFCAPCFRIAARVMRVSR